MKQLIVPVAVLAVLATLLVPLPSVVLDFLLVANMILALVLLVSTLYIEEPIKLSSFPSLILLATLYRLALNISTTRLILGSGEAGNVIEAFGAVVVQGNIIVGAVIFLIITLIQFIVIAKGSERVAEVAARFSLDALPGKQMSIDADVRAGLIDFDEARRKRQDLQTESRFYGALDGAMKFVKGDAIAGLVITLINVVGGLAIGVAVNGLPFGTALSQYTLLTIGDGLLSQIPALLNSLAAGMIVTRVVGANESSLAEDLLAQLGQLRIVKVLIGVVSLILGVLPGLPLLPFVTLGIMLLVFAYLEPSKDIAGEESDDRPEAFHPRPPGVLEIQIGKEITQDVYRGGELLQQVSKFQKESYEKYGLILEMPKFEIDSSSTRRISILMRGIVAFSFTVPEEVQAEKENPLQTLMSGLREIVRLRAPEFIDDILTRRTLDAFEEVSPELVSAVVPSVLSVTQLTEVLKGLMKEGISIRNFDVVLQAVAEIVPKVSDERSILREVRIALGRVIADTYTQEGRMKVIRLDPLLDFHFHQVEAEGVEVDMSHLELIIHFLSTKISSENQGDTVLITSKGSRRMLQECIALNGIFFPVIALEELPNELEFEEVGIISLDDSHAEEALERALSRESEEGI